jgi:branched-chain amino acid transport system permease protein
MYRSFEGEILAIPGRLIGFLGVLFLLSVGLYIDDPYFIKILTYSSIFALFAASWDLLFFTGQLNLGHGAFFGVGAYTSAILSSKLALPISLTIPLGAFTGVIMGIIVAIPALRLRGPYLAIVTLAVPIILKGVVFIFPDLTGGELGLYGLTLISDSVVFIYYFCLCTMLVCVGIMWKLTDTKSRIIRSGIIFCAIREDEISARDSGVNTVRYKMLAFGLSGFFAGIAGGLYAHTMAVVGPSTLDFIFSIYPLIWTIFGGAATIYGPVIGAYVLYILSSQLLVILPELRMAIFTGIIIIMILFMPEGICRWVRDKLEIMCPRCKIINNPKRKSCRICNAPLQLEESVVPENGQSIVGFRP